MKLLAIVGHKNSGKTTFICSIIPLLREKGLHVGVLKHHHGTFSFDTEGTDTFMFAQAGGDIVAISSPEKFALVKNCGPFDPPPLMLAERFFPETDILILEGYKDADVDKYPVIKDVTEIPYWLSSVSRVAGFIVPIEDYKDKIQVPVFSVGQPGTFVAHILLPTSD